ncbi:hypothetical protein HID58_024606 [Brassica napus]|uniref:Uncharacterized protein n=1 Tax=Brassica napus TaxID=3708 RepID=A0ABQ8CIQ3_BRANA|nr:hypothetical protein HID58_024606 [Brassica napus]
MIARQRTGRSGISQRRSRDRQRTDPVDEEERETPMRDSTLAAVRDMPVKIERDGVCDGKLPKTRVIHTPKNVSTR